MVKVLEQGRNFWKFFSLSNMDNVSFVLQCGVVGFTKKKKQHLRGIYLDKINEFSYYLIRNN